jgi:hypothetical protein
MYNSSFSSIPAKLPIQPLAIAQSVVQHATPRPICQISFSTAVVQAII